MPRAPTQKLNHSVPSSSVTGAHSPHPQHRLNNSPPHMGALHPPHPSSNTHHEFGHDQQQYRDDNAGSRFEQPSPRSTPHMQAQLLNSKTVVNQGNQQAVAGQDGMAKAMRNGVSSSMDSARSLQNGNAPSSIAPTASTSASPTAASQAIIASGGPAMKKKHVCPTCDRAFTTSGHLARHARVHTGERNHKCPFPGCETRCSRQDNLQQHYRIHLSPGSRRSSSSATRAAIQRACAKTTPTSVASGNPPDLDSPPPLAQATFPAVHLAQSHPQYAVAHQPYPPSSNTLSQSQVPSPHVAQQSYQPQTPPISNGHPYESNNASGSGLPADVSRGYGRGHPDSPVDHSGPASATPSADASPVIGGPGSVPPVSHPYPTQHPTYIYVQHPTYYTHPQHPSPSSQTPGTNSAVYSTPPPQSSMDGQYQAHISTFYQQHHYPREAYVHPTQASTAAASQAPPNYVNQDPVPQQSHDQAYIEPQKSKAKRRGRTSDGSITNGEQSPSDSPVVGNTQGQAGSRPNGQGQSNVYTYYGMAAPSSSGSAAPPPTSGSAANVPPTSSASSHGDGRYSVNADGFGQFQLHTPPPPPLTSSSTTTATSSVSYSLTPVIYPTQNEQINSSATSGNGTHSPPPVLAPIQQKRPSYHESLPSRYSYGQHPSHTGYASVGKNYSG